jgi:hypothetical protein
MYEPNPIQIGQTEFTDLIDVIVWMCPRRGVAVVECLYGITGYALMVVVPEPVGSGHATE